MPLLQFLGAIAHSFAAMVRQGSSPVYILLYAALVGVPLVLFEVVLQLMLAGGFVATQHFLGYMMELVGMEELLKWLHEETLIHHLPDSRGSLLGFATAEGSRTIFWRAMGVNVFSSMAVAVLLACFMVTLRRQGTSSTVGTVELVAKVVWGAAVLYSVIAFCLPPTVVDMALRGPIGLLTGPLGDHEGEAPIMHVLHGDVVCMYDTIVAIVTQLFLLLLIFAVKREFSTDVQKRPHSQ